MYNIQPIHLVLHNLLSVPCAQFTKRRTSELEQYDNHQVSSSFIMQNAYGENRKIDEGPCSVEFELVEQCARQKGLKDPKVRAPCKFLSMNMPFQLTHPHRESWNPAQAKPIALSDVSTSIPSSFTLELDKQLLVGRKRTSNYV